MKTETAIELVSQLIFRPGWEFEATDHTNRFEGTICVKVTYPAFETNRAEARQGYPVANRPYAKFPVQVSDLDDEGLYRKILEIVGIIDSHEAREALRVLPSYWAPFHPHNIDGMNRWGDADRDLAFGLA